jgi:hypothetical protein
MIANTARFDRFFRWECLNCSRKVLLEKYFYSFALIAFAILGSTMAAAPATFDGEYADKKFLNGQGVFEFSIHQTGGALDIAFDAAYSDGHGAAPDATGAGKVNGNTAEFTWKDSQGNTGTGTIGRTNDGIVVSMKAVHVADPRCVAFYRENMKLKRTGKE